MTIPFLATNEDFELNAGGRYCQLGDSATAAVLDGRVRALQGMEAIVLVDLGPKTGDWARYFCKW